MWSSIRRGVAIGAALTLTTALSGQASAASQVTVPVPATAGWVATGLSLDEGQWMAVSASGMVATAHPTDPVVGGPSNWSSRSGPGGQEYTCTFFSDDLGDHPCLLEGAPYGSLIGRVGEAAFFIGADTWFQSPASGELELAVNDNEPELYLADNLGSFSVRLNPAAAPLTGYRDIQDFANAGFLKTIGTCHEANAVIGFAAGDNLQNPIGQGRPSSWSDIEVQLTVTNTCGEEPVVYVHMTGWAGVPAPEIDRLERIAVLDVPVTLRSDDELLAIDSVFNLVWVGNDDLTVTTSPPQNGYHREERSETAQVSGAWTFSDSEVWVGGWTFTADDLSGANIGTARELNIPTH
jgi:hypothetical protein